MLKFYYSSIIVKYALECSWFFFVKDLHVKNCLSLLLFNFYFANTYICLLIYTKGPKILLLSRILKISGPASRPFSSPLDRRKRGESEFGLSPPGRPAFSSASGRRQASGGGGNLVLLWRVDSRSCFCRIGFLAVAVFGELAHR